MKSREATLPRCTASRMGEGRSKTHASAQCSGQLRGKHSQSCLRKASWRRLPLVGLDR